MPGQAEAEAKLNRQIIGDCIDRRPEGRQLTSEAREQAITEGVKAWQEPLWRRRGSGEAAEVGIKSVTEKVFKK